MKLLLNHFRGNTTIILRNRIINAGLDFSIHEDINYIQRIYKIPQEMMDECVAMARVENDDNMEDFIEYNDHNVIIIIARYGSTKLRDKLLCDIRFDYVRPIIAEHGNDAQREVLMLSEDHWVLCAVARHGNNKHRDYLLTLGHNGVDSTIARYGTNKHRDILVGHAYDGVRVAVAKHGTNKHRNMLLTDIEPMVLAAVVKYGNNTQRRKLLKHENHLVREFARKWLGLI